jgi:hypothetical protein
MVACVFLLASVFLLWGQDFALQQRQRSTQWPPPPERPEEPDAPALKAILKSQHEQTKKDVEKLLELATELKAEMDKTNSEILSLQLIRKAEEIEKLARKIQKRVKG